MAKAKQRRCLAICATDHKKRVDVIQFIKGEWPNGECNLQEPLGVEFRIMYTGFARDTQNKQKDTAACMAVWLQAESMLGDPMLDLVMLDEFTYRVSYNCLSLEEITTALSKCPTTQSVIVTGRGCRRRLLDMADTVTEMRPVRHAF